MSSSLPTQNSGMAIFSHFFRKFLSETGVRLSRQNRAEKDSPYPNRSTHANSFPPKRGEELCVGLILE